MLTQGVRSRTIRMAMTDDKEMTKTTFRLPKSLLREVKHYATDHDMDDTEVFNEAIHEYLAKRAGKK